MQAGNICGLNSMAQYPQICHCEAPKGPWQSREGTSSSYKVPIKTYQPIASVAALSERLAGWQVIGQHRRPYPPCRGGACPSRRNAADPYRPSLKWYALPNCHCEERSDVAISGRQLRFRRKCPIIRPSTARFPRRFAPRNDRNVFFDSPLGQFTRNYTQTTKRGLLTTNKG